MSTYTHTHILSYRRTIISTYICDRPREKVTRVGKLGGGGDFYGFRIYLAVHIFAENLVQLAHCVAKIRLLLCPVDAKHTSSKWTNLYAQYVLRDNVFCIFFRIHM